MQLIVILINLTNFILLYILHNILFMDFCIVLFHFILLFVSFAVTQYILDQQDIKKKNSKSRKKRKQSSEEEAEGSFSLTP